jgi:DHA2 family multidrug resistance protein
VIQGLGLGLVFVPLSTAAFTTLPAHLRTDGTAILTLVRNVGSSVGIPLVISTLVSSTTVMRSNLADYINPFNDALKAPDVKSVIDVTTEAGRAMLDNLLNQQAQIVGFNNSFKLLMILSLISMPLIFVIGKSRIARSPAAPAPVAVD